MASSAPASPLPPSQPSVTNRWADDQVAVVEQFREHFSRALSIVIELCQAAESHSERTTPLVEVRPELRYTLYEHSAPANAAWENTPGFRRLIECDEPVHVPDLPATPLTGTCYCDMVLGIIKGTYLAMGNGDATKSVTAQDWVRHVRWNVGVNDHVATRLGAVGVKARCECAVAICQLAVQNDAPPPAEPTLADGRYLWWQGERHDCPTGVVYRLIDFMWPREAASYGSLTSGVVWDTEVLTATITSAAHKANLALASLDVPWRLSANSRGRMLTKKPRNKQSLQNP
jgi:hypothetical protein